jgi:hypothetical protein
VLAAGLLALVALVALYSRFTTAPLTALTPSASPLQSSAASPTSSSSAAPSATPPSPELERLQARRMLYETVDALIEAGNFARARQLLDEEQARYGDDLAPPWRDLEQGYRLIADCLERPRDPKPRVRAQALLRISEASGLGSKIRAACAR